MVYRACAKNIHWREIKSERLQDIADGLLFLKEQGWQFSSITIDGRKGAIKLIESLFAGMPVQMCLFHQQAIIRRYITGNPKTDCGIAIKNLMFDLQKLSEEQFINRLVELQNTYKHFLLERNENREFRHRRLRSALRSLRSNANWIFTYKRFPELSIPTTTNTCDGSFAHWKNMVKIHRGLRKDRKAKMISFLLKTS